MLDGLVGSVFASVAEASTKEYALWLSMSGVLTAILFATAFRHWRWSRLIEDVPTSRARSAHQGYVELQGSAEMMDGEPIRTPISQRDCVWWSLVVERRSSDGWRVVDRETSEALFHLRDETGTCIIDPEGARVSPPHRRVTVTGRPAMTVTGVRSGQHRNTERFIAPHDRLYVIGMHRTHSGIDHYDSEAELAARLREWKRDQDRLLHRFDANRDGRIDPSEWEAARDAARQELAREHREASLRPGVSVLGLPEDGRPFLIATDHQEGYTRKLRRIALATGALFAASAAVTVLLIAGRLAA